MRKEVVASEGFLTLNSTASRPCCFVALFEVAECLHAGISLGRMDRMRRMRSHTSYFIVACLIASALCISQPTFAQNTNLFKTYYVTGDFASAGAGIRGRGVLDPAT